MEPGPRQESGWERVVDLSLIVAELAVAVPCVPLMAVVGLMEAAAAPPEPPKLDPKLLPGLARARALLERERLRYSVLSESFFVLTKVEEELDAELSSTRTGSSPS